MFELSIFKSSDEFMRFGLSKDSLLIGRANENDICLPDPEISRTHFIIERKGNEFVVTDKSTNGTFINGKRITSQILRSGDKIEIGSWTIIANEKHANQEDDTQVLQMLSTKVLSYSPERHEIDFQKIFLEQVGAKKRPFPITKAITSIGSAPNNDIVIDHEYISNFHCKLENRQGTFFITDLQSTNGTFVNGNKIVETQIGLNSVIELGKTSFKLFGETSTEKVQVSRSSKFEDIISKSTRMREIFALIKRIAQSDATVLIQGETGTGKELIAKSIAKNSFRAAKPMITLNCGAISKDLVESELFGHEKGAFTSAHQQRKGIFEQANGGTVFLDEIGELPLDLQPKLLRVLENGEIRRVGGTQNIHVDVRVLAATHKDLSKDMDRGTFRQDLFYRLYVVPINVPPLRDRPDDIPLLIDHFMKSEFGNSADQTQKKFSMDALDVLVRYDWPGNIRELKNTIRRAVLQADTPIIGSEQLQLKPKSGIDATAFEYDPSKEPAKVGRTLADIEKAKILSELERNNGNKSKTATSLGIAKSTLYEKLKKYGLGS